MRRTRIGVWVIVALASAACGKLSNRPSGAVSIAGEGGEVARSDGAASSGGAAGGGGAAAAAGALTTGGAAGRADDAMGGAGAAGSPEAQDPRFVVVEPPPVPSKIRWNGTIALKASQVIAGFPSDLTVSDDGAVVIGIWTSLFRLDASTTGSFPQAFRWTEETGSIAVIEQPISTPSFPLGMSGDGSVVFATTHEDQLSGVCRWTEAQGCQKLGNLDWRVDTEACFNSHCSSHNGASLVVSTSSPGITRWSRATGWQQLPSMAAIDLDDAGNALIQGGQGSALWMAGGAVVPLTIPDGFVDCQARLSPSGTLLAGGCRTNAGSESAFRWQSPQVVKSWKGPPEVADVARDGSSAVGVAPVQDAVGSHNVIQYWDEQDGLVTIEDPGPEGIASPNTQTLGRDGRNFISAVVLNLNLSLAEYFQWSKAHGKRVLEVPASTAVELSATSSDGSLAGGSAGLFGSRSRAAIWDHLGLRFVDDELRAMGIDLGALSLETVLSVETLDSEVRVVGTLRTAPDSNKEFENQAARIYVARLPSR